MIAHIFLAAVVTTNTNILVVIAVALVGSLAGIGGLVLAVRNTRRQEVMEGDARSLQDKWDLVKQLQESYRYETDRRLAIEVRLSGVQKELDDARQERVVLEVERNELRRKIQLLETEVDRLKQHIAVLEHRAGEQ